MKLKKALILFVLLLLAIGFLAFFLISHLNPIEVKSFPFDFNVTNEGPGFNLDPDKVHFGSVPPSSSAGRKLIYSNPGEKPLKVRYLIASDRPISSWFYFFPAHKYTIEPKKNVLFKISLTPPPEAELGFYEGLIIAETYRSWPWETNTKPEDKENSDQKANSQTPKLGGVFTNNFTEIISSKIKK